MKGYKIIGRGSYGKVFSYDEQYAYKLMEYYEFSWIKEILISRYLECDNIIKHLNITKKHKNVKYNKIFIKMERFNPLNKFKIKKDKNILLILKDVAFALQLCEKKKIFHRDVKESNIVLEIIDNKIKRAILIDFGLSHFNLLKSDLCVNVVTSSHRPPELPENNIYDYRIDTWGFGLIIVYLITGKDFMEYTKKDSKEFIKLIKDRETFLSILQVFIEKYTQYNLLYTKFYSVLLNECLKKYEERPCMSVIYTKIIDFIKKNNIHLLKNTLLENKLIPFPNKYIINKALHPFFKLRYFNNSKWLNMENTIYFINSENTELIYLTRTLVLMEEYRIFLKFPKTNLVFISVYLMLENILIDLCIDIKHYRRVLKRAKIPFSIKNISTVILEIMDIFDYNILEILSNIINNFTKESRYKNLGRIVSDLQDIREDC